MIGTDERNKVQKRVTSEHSDSERLYRETIERQDGNESEAGRGEERGGQEETEDKQRETSEYLDMWRNRGKE